MPRSVRRCDFTFAIACRCCAPGISLAPAIGSDRGGLVMRTRILRLVVPAAVMSGCLPILVPVALAGNAAAPPAAILAPAWTLHLDGEVEWQRVAPLGQLLVKTTSALSAIDPERGRVLWTHADLGGLAQDHYEEIGGTSLVTISDGATHPRTVVLDTVDGRVV